MKSCLFFLCLLAGSQLYAQQKFIEVTVTDTVLARANLFVYRISKPAIMITGTDPANSYPIKAGFTVRFVVE